MNLNAILTFIGQNTKIKAIGEQDAPMVQIVKVDAVQGKGLYGTTKTIFLLATYLKMPGFVKTQQRHVGT